MFQVRTKLLWAEKTAGTEEQLHSSSPVHRADSVTPEEAWCHLASQVGSRSGRTVFRQALRKKDKLP